MSLKSIRESYSKFISTLENAGVKINESQKADLDSFILAIESKMQKQKELAIKSTKKIVTEHLEAEYKKIFESIMQHQSENVELAGKIQSKITALKESDIQTIVNTLGLAPKTIRNYVGFIQAATGHKYNVALPQRVKPQVRIPNDMEVAGLIRLAQDMYPDLEVPVMLGCFGPLRRSEICALTLQDFQGDWVNITKGLIKDEHGQFQLKDIPKTTESARRIKLPHFVVKKIREQGYVTKYNPDQISHYFRRMQQRVGLEDVYCFHSTRHYCVSSLHANGLPDAYIMERGGWSTPDVLIYVYRHTISDETAALTDKALNHFDSVTKFVTN